MARTEFKVQANNFTGGLVTEASPLSFPENSCLDIENMDINIDGSVSRRHALRPSGDSIPTTLSAIGSYEQKMPIYVWRQAAGIPGNNLIVVQTHTTLQFYREGDTLTHLANAVTLSPLVAITPQPPVSMTNVRGTLVVTAENIAPFTVEYVDTTPPTFNTTLISFSVRDLDGLDDGLAVDERPATLSDFHLYNLLNQGWDSAKINQFRNATTHSGGRYPSNADIWSAGRNADNNFAPAELVKIDFGTSPAPKGRNILNPFNTLSTFTFFDDADKVDIVDGTYSLWSGDPTLIIEVDSPQTFVVGDNVYIADYAAADATGTDDLTGEHEILEVISTTEIRIALARTYLSASFFTVCDDCFLVLEDDYNIADTGYTTNTRPSVVATYAGRAFYAGIPFGRLSNQIFFSQILTDTQQRLGKCHQDADPTSEIDPDIIATDGGVITINDLGEVLAMREQQQSLVVFSTNGVWEIRGEGDNFFTALGYSVRKITSVPVVSGCAVVDVEGTMMFMGEDGIYILQPNEISGLLEATNITAGNIKSYYLENIMPCNGFTCGVYDYKRRQVLWLHGTPAEQWSTTNPAKGRIMHKALVFNLDTRSFTKYTFPFTHDEPDDTTPRIFGAVQLRNISASSAAIRFLTRIRDDDVNELGWLTLDKPKEEGFEDENFMGALELPARVITGNATLDDVGVKKTARQLILHMLRTETGFDINGEEYTPIHPSSAKVRIAWDFTNDEASNKWMPEFQGYRYRQLYIPVDTSFNTGYEVITTKTKLRGTGRAFSMQFRSEPGHDMNILGWSISGSAETHE